MVNVKIVPNIGIPILRITKIVSRKSVMLRKKLLSLQPVIIVLTIKSNKVWMVQIVAQTTVPIYKCSYRTVLVKIVINMKEHQST